MGAAYSRQSSYTTGDTIQAADTNDEFDQVLAVFNSSSGHTHDGTTGEGGPITKLLGNSLTFGAATSGTDITITFDGESNDGVITWMEDEDHFKFSDDMVLDSTKRLYFFDEGGEYIYGDGTDLYLVSGADINIPANIGLTFGDDGEKIEGDGTDLTISSSAKINLTATSDVHIPNNVGIVFGGDSEKIEGDGTDLTISANNLTVDAAADINLDAGGADIVLKDDGTQYGAFTNTSGDLIIKSGSTTAMTFSGANVTFAGTVTIGSAGISEAELEILDGASVTTTELNIIDGDTSATSTTVADADRVVMNDNGTMVQVAVTDLAAYFDDEITAMPNLTSVGTLTTLTVDNVIINGTTIGHTSDTDLLTMASGVLTVAGEVDATSLDISGDADIDGTLEADAITVDGTALATYIRDTVGTNMLSSNTESGITVTYDTSNDNIDFAIDAAQTGITSILATDVKIGEDDQTKIDFETADEIHFFANNVSLISLTNANSGDAVLTVPTADKNFTIKGTDGSSAITALDIDMALAGKSTFNGDVVVGGDLTVTGDDLIMGTNTSGHVLVADGTNYNPVAISGDITIASNGAVTIASTAVENSMLAGSIADSKLSTITTADKVSGAAIQVDGATDGTSITVADADKFLIDDGGTTKYINASQLNSYISAEATSLAADNISTGDAAVTIATSSGNITIDAQAGDADIIFKGTDSSSDITALTLDMSEAGAATFNDKIVATELDISGNIDIDGTSNLDAVDIDGAVQIDATVTVGVDDTGYDVKFFGDTASAYMLWDTSADDLILGGGAGLIVPDGQFSLGSTAVTSTAAELNLIDGGTARGTTAVASGDGILINDGGTMRMTNVDTVSTYFASHNVGGGNIVTTGALNSGSITSGFGTIDTGSSAITTTGLISGGSLDIDDVLINGSTIGHTDDTDLITVADGLVTVAGEISVTTLDIGGTNVTATAAELNLLDGGTSVGSTITLADADGFVVNDGGTMKTIPATDVKTYASGSSATKGFAIAAAIVFG